MIPFGLLGGFDENARPTIRTAAGSTIRTTGDDRNDAPDANLHGLLQCQFKCRRLDQAQAENELRFDVILAATLQDLHKGLALPYRFYFRDPDAALAVEYFHELFCFSARHLQMLVFVSENAKTSGFDLGSRDVNRFNRHSVFA